MDEGVRRWKNRYPGRFISPTKMVDNIEASDDVDSFEFRMDFLMCFVTVMVDPNVNPLTFWNMSNLKERQKLEIKGGGFGIGPFKGLSSSNDIEGDEDTPLVDQMKVRSKDQIFGVLKSVNLEKGESSSNEQREEEDHETETVAREADVEKEIGGNRQTGESEENVEIGKTDMMESNICGGDEDLDNVIELSTKMCDEVTEDEGDKLGLERLGGKENKCADEQTDNEWTEGLENIGEVEKLELDGTWESPCLSQYKKIESGSELMQADNIEKSVTFLMKLDVGGREEEASEESAADQGLELTGAPSLIVINVKDMQNGNNGGAKTIGDKIYFDEQCATTRTKVVKTKNNNLREIIAELESKRKNSVREKVIAIYDKSPYQLRGVNLNSMVTKEDEQVREFICNDEGILYELHGDFSRKKAMETNFELLFRSTKNVVATRELFKSLKADVEVSDDVIDCWVEVLNYEERFILDSSQHRLFVNTKEIFSWMLNDEKTNKEKRMERFRNNMKVEVNGDEKLADLKDFDMVLFSVLEFNHYYLMNDQQQGILQEGSCYKIKELFVDYLEEKKHPKTNEITTTNIHNVKLEWTTTNNYTDCGVFLMRHTERFMGLHEMFECEITKNGRKKLTELKKLRKKMDAHILLSSANVLKETVGAEALKEGKVVAAV
ncbi:hypothetical protein L1987_58246 [Smallanthus sonchifolius]|uniref:Uncharacterized protein n=1 Tax=Smallanthus sonchifolius TaxID=185202 RepID=A0ACB9DF25_9ASTR|nr:hypothetical protein L1987_58246 [Smallanthus sonchifolius]